MQNQKTNNSKIEIIENVKVYFSKEEDTIVHVLPGEIYCRMPANYYRQIFNAEKVQKPKAENSKLRPTYGLIAKPKVYISENERFLTHSVLGLRWIKSVNYYKKILEIPFEPVASSQPQTQAS